MNSSPATHGAGELGPAVTPQLVGRRRVNGDEHHGDPDGGHEDHETVESVAQRSVAIVADVAVDPAGGEGDVQGEDGAEGDPRQEEAEDHGASKPLAARPMMAVAVARGSRRRMTTAASLFTRPGVTSAVRPSPARAASTT